MIIRTPESRQNLFTVGSERESLPQERLSRNRKTRYWQRNDKDLVENYEDVTLTAHSSDANLILESNRAAQLADLDRELLKLFRETDDACSRANISVFEGLIAAIQSVSSDISKTGCPLIQYYNKQSDYVQVDALRLRYDHLTDERANQARQRLTDRLYFLNEVPEGNTLVRLRTHEYDLLSFVSEAEKALCSNDDAFLSGLIDDIKSVTNESVSLARPLRQMYDQEGKFKETDSLKRKFDPLTVDRVNLVINRL